MELLAFFILIIVTIAAVFVRKSRTPSAAQSHKREVRDAKRTLRDAERTHTTAIKSANSALRVAEQTRDSAIKSSEKRLSDLQNPTGRAVGHFQGIVLFERAIRTPNGSGSLVGTHALVDTAGNLATKSRASLTRMAAGGLLLGPVGAVLSLGFKKHKNVDKRELYLLIESPEFASVVQCDPDKGLQARQFAARVNTQAAHAASFEINCQLWIEQTQDELARLRRDSSVVDEAAAQLRLEETNNERLVTITGARNAVAQLESTSTPTISRKAA